MPSFRVITEAGEFVFKDTDAFTAVCRALYTTNSQFTDFSHFTTLRELRNAGYSFNVLFSEDLE